MQPPIVDRPLSRRPREVLILLAQGLRQEQIAARRGISPSTAHTHCCRLYAKLGVHSRLGAVVKAYARGMVDGEERTE